MYRKETILTSEFDLRYDNNFIWVFKLPFNDDKLFIPPQKCSMSSDKYDAYDNHYCRIVLSTEIYNLYYDKDDCLDDGWYHYSDKSDMQKDIIEFIKNGSIELKQFYKDNPDCFI